MSEPDWQIPTGRGGSGSMLEALGGGGMPRPHAHAAEGWESMPLWAKFATDSDKRIRVEFFDTIENRWVQSGEMPSNAGIDTLVHTFKKPGKFRLYLLASDGTLADEQPKVVPIANDHLVLKALREQEGPVPVAAPLAQQPVHPHGTNPVEVASLVQSMMAPQLESIQAERRRLDEMETRLRAQSEAVAFKSEGAATLLLDRNATQTEKVIEMQTALAAKSHENVANTFTGLIAMQNAQAALREAEMRAANDILMTRMQQMALQESAAHDRRLAEMKLDLDNRRLAMERESQERADRLQRDRDEDKRRADADREREREHYARMTALQANQGNPLAALTTMIAPGIALADKMGIDVGGVLKGLIGGQASGGMVETIVGSVRDIVVEGMKMQRAMAGGGAGDEPDDDSPVDGGEMVQVQMPDGKTHIMPRAQAEALNNQWLAAQQARGIVPPQVAQAPVAAAAPTTAPAPAEFVVPPWATSANAPAAAPAAPAAADGVSPATKVMSPADLRTARKQAGALVSKLRGLPEDQWQVTLTAALTPQLIAYIKACTLAGVLDEISVDATMRAQMLSASERSGFEAIIGSM